MLRKRGRRFSEIMNKQKIEHGGTSFARRELDALFHDFSGHAGILLAVSGGPDSTALMWLAARWRDARKNAPALVAASVDHRLRPEAKREAAEVAKLAKQLKIPHHILSWRGKKPKSGVPEAARNARYELLLALAKKTGADAIVTAHTRDDQAETMLHRIGRGSGVTGLAGIRRKTTRNGIEILRPLLSIPKARLEALLRKNGVSYAVDPTNSDPRFLRPRLRKLAPELAREGIDAARLSLLAKRLARVEAAIEAAVREALPRATLRANEGSVQYDARTLFALPEEIGLRLIARAVNRVGHEGPAELGKLESLHAALAEAWRLSVPLRRTLAGALAALGEGRLTLEPAPFRRGKPRKRAIRQGSR
jgi:tRNA(Ile)-lysidine synthase